MMETQQQQTELLRQILVTAPREQRPGNVLDFSRLQLIIFTGEEKPLDAEQWFRDIIDLLIAARIPTDNQVAIAKIQLKDVARSWWLVEEARLEKAISWAQFLKSFYERFFFQQQPKRTWRSSSLGCNKGTDLLMNMLQNFKAE